MKRISIARLLGFVVVFAVGLAALVNATAIWAGIVFYLTLSLLLASVLGLILQGWRRGGWLGFAIFGWAYLLLGHTSAINLNANEWLLPDQASDWVFSASNRRPIPPPSIANAVPGSTSAIPESTAYFIANDAYNERFAQAMSIGRWIAVLIFAEVGAVVGVLLARGRRPNDPSPLTA